VGRVKSNQARLQEIAINAWNIGLFEHDHLSGRVHCSAHLRQLYGFAPDQEITVDSFIERMFPADRDFVREAVASAHDPSGDGKYNVIHRIIDADGNMRWLHIRAQTEFGEKDSKRVPLLTTGSAMDVTQQQEFAREAQRNEQRLTQATQASKVGIYEHDPLMPDSPPYWSPTMRELLGYDVDRPASYEWYHSRVHPDDVHLVNAAIQKANDPGSDGRIALEYRWHHPNGQMRWLLVRGSTIFGEIDGKRTPIRNLGAILDITEVKAAEAEQRRHSAILDATPDFVAISNHKGNVVYLNQTARTFMGIGKDEDVTRYSMKSAHTPAALKIIADQGIPTAIRQGSWKAETEFLRHDGEIVPMSQVLLVHRDSFDNITYVSTIARDLSRERELEEQFRQSQKMEAIGRLAGGIAHDFNNLLSVIMGFIHSATDLLEPEHLARPKLKEVQLASERAASLTGQLLAFSRKQILQLSIIDINETIKELHPLLRRLVDESIQVTTIPCSGSVHIKADPNQIQQILLNLVVNARDAMPDGGQLTIETRQLTLERSHTAAKLQLSPGNYVAITVSDTGYGMDAETREKVFEPFFTTKGPGQGTGIGLSTVFGIVKQLEGGISLESEPGKGTTFNIYLPCSQEPVPQSIPTTTTTHPVAGGTVLVTEDNAPLREVVTMILDGAGFNVLSAANPEEALEIADRNVGTIDLLLTDVRMPGMNGRQLADKLRSKRPGLAVLFMSGYAENNIVHQGVLDPNVNFIAKPVAPERLIARVHEILRQRNI
jgi:two-component system cell cycle sensor histidine kinase/response regulator CckA